MNDAAPPVDADPSHVNPVFHEEYWQGSDRFYIFFTGILPADTSATRLALAERLVSHGARIHDYSRIYLRDPYQVWYQRGLPGIGDNIYDVARFLEGKIAQSGAREVRFVGNCMGGHAAMLCCALIGRGRAVAFVPQTGVIGADSRHHVTSALMQYAKPEHIYNLAPWLREHAPDLHADIHVARDHAEDMAHAQALEGFRNIRIHYHESGGHHLILHALRLGELPAIFAA